MPKPGTLARQPANRPACMHINSPVRMPASLHAFRFICHPGCLYDCPLAGLTCHPAGQLSVYPPARLPANPPPRVHPCPRTALRRAGGLVGSQAMTQIGWQACGEEGSRRGLQVGRRTGRNSNGQANRLAGSRPHNARRSPRAPSSEVIGPGEPSGGV